MIDYLDLDDVLAAAEAHLGHPPDVSDYGLPESALARPQATVFGDDAYPDIHGKAAALLQSLATNHALVDGNKRTAFVATVLFYGLNGHRVSAGETARLHSRSDSAPDPCPQRNFGGRAAPTA